MNVSFHFAALQYLNQWLEKEKRIYEDLHSSDREIRRKAIVAGASHFRVARTLPKTDERQRYRQVLDILDPLRAKEVQSNTAVAVLKTCKNISIRYHDASVLSFTTKLLWLKFRSPVVIYDSRARKALKVDRNQFDQYWRAWHSEYDRQESKVIAACRSLTKAMPYVIDSTVPKAKVELLCNMHWFQHRVFDIYLWYKGA